MGGGAQTGEIRDFYGFFSRVVNIVGQLGANSQELWARNFFFVRIFNPEILLSRILGPEILFSRILGPEILFSRIFGLENLFTGILDPEMIFLKFLD